MPTQLFEVTPNILCIRRPSYFTCSYLVRQAGGIVAVDAGMDSDGADLYAGLRHWGAGAGDLRAILLTHWHNDHAAGAAELKKAGAEVYYHAADEPELTRRTARMGFRGWLSELIPEIGFLVLFKGLLGEASPRAVSATLRVSDGELIAGGFRVVETPGHTAGHISFYYEPERALFAGDALAVIGERIRFMARPVTLDHQKARESMKKILSLDSAIICPGHRAPLTTGVARQREEMLRHLEADGPWPLLG
jgi:glyoxylase-like metal-dependent hydrolase (beta-lactamase superfamily II)